MSANVDEPQVRQTRLKVTVDGQVSQSAIDARVVSTNYYSADWFQVSFALTAGGFPDSAYLAETDRAEIVISISLNDGQTYTDLIIGRADGVTIDPVNRIARVEGRDLSGVMVDTSLQETFVNQNGSSIAALLALRHGLDIDVYPTPDLFGRADGTDYTALALGQFCRGLTEWDLIVRLAQQFGYDAYVSGRTFYFQPTVNRRADTTAVAVDDLISIQLNRTLPVGEAPMVGLATWNYQFQSEYMSEAGTPLADGTATAGGFQYYASLPNVTPDLVAQLSTQYNEELLRYRQRIDMSMPGELSLWPRGQLLLEGTGTAFDRKYDIECVDRSYSPVTGYRQHVRARRSV